MGVYQIRNIANEKVLIGAALDLPGVINRHKFQARLKKAAIRLTMRVAICAA
jgi:hypothetical protein